jgi:leucyl/phenylalanyl-tRNA---protein transferase
MEQHDLTSSLYWVRDCRLAHDFPPTDHALDEPDGLLAIGGDLSPERLVHAYSLGIFPWYSDGQPVLWWTPNPRSVLKPAAVHVSKSLAKTMRKAVFAVCWDRAFEQVIDACAAPRGAHAGTWITTDMRSAYLELHQRGVAHSVECWRDGVLCGGLYGIAIGRAFFGESMFSRERDASKVAFVHLCRLLDHWGYSLIDCQIHTQHLERLGAGCVSRREFEALLRASLEQAVSSSAWRETGHPM